MSGRSRGRAKIRTDTGQHQPPIADTSAPPAAVAAPVVPPPAVTKKGVPPPPIARSSTESVVEGGRGRATSSSETLASDAGRGRGIATALSTTGTPPSTIGSGETQVSPLKTSSSEGSPEQQHSPPQSTASGASTAGQGRASNRGKTLQPGVNIRTELLPPMERLQLQDTGDVTTAAAAKPEVRMETVLHTRPESCKEKHGTAGQPIKIFTNYFEVVKSPDWVLYQYHVDFAPVIDSRALRVGLMKNHDKLFPSNKAFDGSTLYSLTKLHDEMTEVASTLRTDGTIIQIKIKRVGEIVSTSPQFVHLFNLVFRRCLKMYGMQEIDRNFYDMKNKIQIPEYKLELINGLATSIAACEDKLLLCAELTHKLLHKNTIHDVMNRIYSTVRSEQDFKEQCMNEIAGRIVMTRYNNKTYKIDDIDWNSNPANSFETKRGKVTFVEYYKTNYDETIRDHQQPLLISLPSGKDKRRAEQMGVEAKPALLIPELCIITGVDEKMRTDFKFKKALEEVSKVGPMERCKRLTNFITTFKAEENVKTELDKWKMDFSNQPAELAGRVLKPEILMFGRGVTRVLNEKADWGNEMKSCSLFKTVALIDWIIVYSAAKRNSASMFAQTYSEVIRSMGIEARAPKNVEVQQDSPDLLYQTLSQHITDKTQMVVVIVSSKRKDRYDAIKRVCCLEKPVPSQVCTSAIIDAEKKRRSVVTKIAIQMNAKLGGEIWQSNIPLKNTMICGIDTYHDSAKKNRSVCAFIATSNPTYTKFFSRATLQETHQELSSNLLITIKSACDHYYRQNTVYPDKIIIYRDGVSDGQLEMVVNYEIPQIEKAFAMIDANYKPKMAVIVVKKRGNTRFFAKYGPNSPLTNPPCGSVMDTVVTKKEWFDFFLISQCVTQGTVNPTHYNIIHDTIGMPADRYQQLSFKLCHMYYNWPGTIRVPATCQYAHKLAFLVGQSLHKEHHSSLCDKLFYL